MMCAYASHGDTRHICLYPADPREAFEFAVASFDLAERFQTPVFVLSDLDIGMNDWMIPKLTWDDSYRPDRGKVLSAEELDEVKTFSPLPRRRRRRHPVAHASGRAPEGRVLHARLRPQPVRRLHRGRRRVRRGDRSHRPQDPARGARGSGAGHADRGRARRSGWSPSAAATPRAWKRSICSRAEGIAIDYMRVRGFPFGDEVAPVPRLARGQLHRRAEPRRAAAQPADARDRRAGRRSSSRCGTTAGSR